MAERNLFENIINNLKAFSGFSEEELMHYLSLIENKEYKKHKIILDSGDLCNKLYFISKGLVRCYYEVPSKETTLDILKENEYFTDYLSFYSRKKTPYVFETLEDTEVYTISYENIHMLKDQNDDFAKFCRILIETSYVEMLSMNNSLKIRTPKERYLYYIEKRGDICNRTPLMYIASMLNMNQSTLSRIRKQLAQEKEVHKLQKIL